MGYDEHPFGHPVSVPFRTTLGRSAMARKVVNRKKLREEAESVAAAEKTAKKKKTAKKTTVKRKTRAKKSAADERKKIFWGIFSQSLKRVALYEFHQKKQADKKAVDLSKGGKTPHFVQKVKEVIVEE
jgi:hypothetical protein